MKPSVRVWASGREGIMPRQKWAEIGGNGRKWAEMGENGRKCGLKGVGRGTNEQKSAGGAGMGDIGCNGAEICKK